MPSSKKSKPLAGVRALITGAGGFVGSHLVERLLADGATVTALFRYTSHASSGALADSDALKSIKILYGDIRDPETCERAVEKQHIIFHLAAQVAIPYSYLAPRDFEDVNVRGTINLLQAALANRSLKRFLMASSSEVYGAAQYVPMDETHPLSPQSPYAASKVSAEMFALTYSRSFGLPVTVTRAFNTYGPRQSARAIIPTIILQALTSSRIKLGATTPTRDFVFVDDVTAGLISAATATKTLNQAVNLCTGTEISIADVVTAVSTYLGKKLTVTTEKQRIRPKNSEVSRLCGSGAKLKKLTGFTPRVVFADGIASAIEYYSQSESKTDPEEYQI